MTFPLFIELLSEKQLFLTLAVMNLTQFILMLFMPETNGLALPETIKEIEEEEKEEINKDEEQKIDKSDDLEQPLLSHSIMTDQSKSMISEKNNHIINNTNNVPK